MKSVLISLKYPLVTRPTSVINAETYILFCVLKAEMRLTKHFVIVEYTIVSQNYKAQSVKRAYLTALHDKGLFIIMHDHKKKRQKILEINVKI